jgi:RNA polymerase sigma-70 factor (ECF subfamily)
MGVDDRTDENVYVAHASELVRFAAGLVGPDDAPDVVVEAFVRITRSDVWAHAVNRRSLWVRAVVNESKSWLRSESRRRARERRSESIPSGINEVAEADAEVWNALASLSVQQRAVVVCTYWLDLDAASTAELLEVSEGTVRKQLARARARLKGELG